MPIEMSGYVHEGYHSKTNPFCAMGKLDDPRQHVPNWNEMEAATTKARNSPNQKENYRTPYGCDSAPESEDEDSYNFNPGPTKTAKPQMRQDPYYSYMDPYVTGDKPEAVEDDEETNFTPERYPDWTEQANSPMRNQKPRPMEKSPNVAQEPETENIVTPLRVAYDEMQAHRAPSMANLQPPPTRPPIPKLVEDNPDARTRQKIIYLRDEQVTCYTEQDDSGKNVYIMLTDDSDGSSIILGDYVRDEMMQAVEESVDVFTCPIVFDTKRPMEEIEIMNKRERICFPTDSQVDQKESPVEGPASYPASRPSTAPSRTQSPSPERKNQSPRDIYYPPQKRKEY